MEAKTARAPSLSSRLVKRLLLWLYRWKGWTLSGETSLPGRCVILGAPHTSNWDFVFFLGATSRLGVEPAFMGKHTLFKWPMTRFMLDMGGVPVNRSTGGNYVEALIAEFKRRSRLALVIAPEGTRSSKGGWKSGFYHIALGAGVPIVPAWVNNETMQGGIGPALMPSGDYQADLAKLAAFYRSVLPDHPRVLAIEGGANA
ncbi:lysophospholipid acyltransferase family protein [Novosphingobium sp.]|uniref:lysophospholipid acyltransferase family protein n=1 Tax=Novosphingobium sp. TaxID=1874826 RepID=UPI0035AF2855